MTYLSKTQMAFSTADNVTIGGGFGSSLSFRLAASLLESYKDIIHIQGYIFFASFIMFSKLSKSLVHQRTSPSQMSFNFWRKICFFSKAFTHNNSILRQQVDIQLLGLSINFVCCIIVLLELDCISFSFVIIQIK